MKDNPNFKIIWFEEMKNDLPKVIKDLCTFLGYELSPEKVNMLRENYFPVRCFSWGTLP